MTEGYDRKAVSTAPGSAAAEPGKGDSVPLCFVVDQDASVRHFLSLILHGAGVDTQEFADGPAMVQALARRRPGPDLPQHRPGIERGDPDRSSALYKHGYFGFIQLMSNRGAAVLEHVKSVGDQHRLQMLPVLKKPFDTSAITAIMQELKLGDPAPTAARVDLGEALNNNWVEFWFQPKIDLRKKRLAGLESFARVRDPEFGVLPPAAFMPGATDDEVLRLSELALTSALNGRNDVRQDRRQSAHRRQHPDRCLAKLPIADIVRMHLGPGDPWPGLIIDIPEDQIVSDLAHASRSGSEARTRSTSSSRSTIRAQSCQACPAQEAAFCRAQARPHIRDRLRERQGQCAAVQDDHRSRPSFRQPRGRQRHRKIVRRARADQHGLRHRPGISCSASRCRGTFRDAAAATHRAVRPRTDAGGCSAAWSALSASRPRGA